MEALRKVTRVIDAISEYVGRGAAWLCLVVVLVGAFNAILGKLGSWFGAQLTSNVFIELQWHLFAAILLLGGAYTLKHRGHVRVDVLYARWNPKTRAWIDLCGIVFLLIPFCGFIIWNSADFAKQSWKIREISGNAGGLPLYPVKTLIPLAFILLLAQGICEALKLIEKMVLKNWEDEPDLKAEKEAAA